MSRTCCGRNLLGGRGTGALGACARRGAGARGTHGDRRAAMAVAIRGPQIAAPRLTAGPEALGALRRKWVRSDPACPLCALRVRGGGLKHACVDAASFPVQAAAEPLAPPRRTCAPPSASDACSGSANQAC